MPLHTSMCGAGFCFDTCNVVLRTSPAAAGPKIPLMAPTLTVPPMAPPPQERHLTAGTSHSLPKVIASPQPAPGSTTSAKGTLASAPAHGTAAIASKTNTGGQKDQARPAQQKAPAKALTSSGTSTGLPAQAAAASTATARLSAKEARKANKARKNAGLPLNQGMVISAVAPRRTPSPPPTLAPAQAPLVVPAVKADASAASAPLALGNAAIYF